MQDNRIDTAAWSGSRGSAVPVSSRVQGMGLCDALRVELEPCQIAGAIDELEERRGPLNEAYEHARTRWDEVADRERGSETARLQEELSKSAYALRVLTSMRGELPTASHGKSVTLVGPASTVSNIVSAAARNAVDDLAELIRESPKTDERNQTRLRCATAAVAAWVETYIECEALEWFNFDPCQDPVEPME